MFNKKHLSCKPLEIKNLDVSSGFSSFEGQSSFANAVLLNKKKRQASVSYPNQEPILPALDTLGVPIPRALPISSKPCDNDIELVRKRLRKNFINHHTYDPNLDSETLGRDLFDGVYELNNLKHVNNNSANNGEPTNLYEKLYELR
jgi:hypothetical protein